MRFALLSAIGLLVLAPGLAGCSSESPTPFTSPVSPSPIAPPIAAPAPTPHTLSGLVFESTAAGRVPVAGVEIYCDACGSPNGHTFFTTAGNGLYSFGWAYNGVLPLLVQKDGYTVVGAMGILSDGSARRSVTINGDTQFDIELVRR